MNENVKRDVSAFLGMKIHPIDMDCPERAVIGVQDSTKVYCFSGATTNRYCTHREEGVSDCPYRQKIRL